MRLSSLSLILLAACSGGAVPLGDKGTDDTSTDSGDSGDSADSTDSADSGDSGETGETGETDTGEPVVITGTATVAANEYNPFSAIVTVTVDHDAEVVVEYGEGAFDHATPAVSAHAGVPVEVVVLGLRAERSFGLHAVATYNAARWQSEDLAFTTEALDPYYPTCRPTFYETEDEYSPDEVVCTNGSGRGQYFYLCVDRWGEPVFAVRTNQNDSLMSMRPLRDGRWASTSFTNSKVAIFDPKGRQVSQYTPTWFEGRTRFEHQYVDSHELYQIPDGAWSGAIAFLTNSYEWFEDGSYKLGNGLIVMDPDTEEVLYDYSFHGELGDGVAMDEAMPYDRDGHGDYAQDWNHANTILWGADDDGREFLLVSLKSQDWIFKLYPDTDELAWALGWDGDFTLVDDIDAADPTPRPSLDWQYHQHGVVWIERDGPRYRLLMLDNGYPRHDEEDYRWDLTYSRILQLQIDEETMLADIDFEYGATSNRDNDWMFSSTCGNSELLPGEDAALTLMGESKTMLEVSYPEGEKRWALACTSSEWCEYRVHWYPSLYELDWDQR